MPYRFELRDDQWERLKDLLPGRPGHVGANGRDNRLFVNAVLYRYRAGIPWRDLPERYGHFRKIHTRFMRWCRKGVWLKVFMVLVADADNEYAEIDSTIVRAHQHSAGGISKDEPEPEVIDENKADPEPEVVDESKADPEPEVVDKSKDKPGQEVVDKKKRRLEREAIGRSKGGLSTKIHVTVDALGNPTSFFLTPGQAHDLDGADVLLPRIKADVVIADKGYDAQERVIDRLEPAGKTAVIPSRKNAVNPREIDEHMYKWRHLIENFFAKLKQYRCIATRYDKLAVSFLGAIHLVASVIWLI